MHSSLAVYRRILRGVDDPASADVRRRCIVDRAHFMGMSGGFSLPDPLLARDLYFDSLRFDLILKYGEDHYLPHFDKFKRSYNLKCGFTIDSTPSEECAITAATLESDDDLSLTESEPPLLTETECTLDLSSAEVIELVPSNPSSVPTAAIFSFPVDDLSTDSPDGQNFFSIIRPSYWLNYVNQWFVNTHHNVVNFTHDMCHGFGTTRNSQLYYCIYLIIWIGCIFYLIGSTARKYWKTSLLLLLLTLLWCFYPFSSTDNQVQVVDEPVITPKYFDVIQW